MKKIFAILTMIICLFSLSAFAQSEPLTILRQTSDEMLGELNKNLSQLKTNEAIVYKIVNKVLLPHFDLTSMTRSVVGREAWQNAAPDQRQQLIKEFTHYVIKTYASAISSYDGETIKFHPLREEVRNKTRVQIDSNLILQAAPPVSLQYRLVKTANTWLIYDFSVDGVSLVRNYQEQFASTIRQGGVAQLITELQQRNKK